MRDGGGQGRSQLLPLVLHASQLIRACLFVALQLKLCFQSNFIDTASVTMEEVPTGTRSRTRVLRGRLFSTRFAAPGTLRFSSFCTFARLSRTNFAVRVVLLLLLSFFSSTNTNKLQILEAPFFGFCELSGSFLSCCCRLSAFLSFFSSSLLFLFLLLPKCSFSERRHKGR